MASTTLAPQLQAARLFSNKVYFRRCDQSLRAQVTIRRRSIRSYFNQRFSLLSSCMPQDLTSPFSFSFVFNL